MNPYNVTRTLVLVVREVISELWSASRQRRLGRPAAHPSRLRLRARARVGHRHPARPAGQLGDRRHVRRPARRLHDVPGLRRGRASLRDRAARSASDAAPGRSPDRPDRLRRANGRRAPTGWSCCPTTASRRARRSASVTAASLEELVHEVVAVDAVAIEDSPSEALAFLGASLAEASARSAGALRRAHARDQSATARTASTRRTATGGGGAAPAAARGRRDGVRLPGADLLRARPRARYARADRSALPRS